MEISHSNPTAPRTRANPIALAMLVATALAISGACRDQQPSIQKQEKRAGASRAPVAVKLTVLVAGDDQLAEGVRLLTGEWKARSGGELTVTTTTLEELDPAKELSADVVIFPSRWLGALVERNSLRPMRDSVLNNPQLALSDVFPAIRDGEMRYGNETMALPLGSPPLLAAYRGDLIKFHGGSPPQTWDAYRELVSLAPNAPVEQSDPSSVHVAYPLGTRDAAYPLIARAISYTDFHSRPEALFDPADMRPRITSAPFVRALAEITAELATRNELDIAQPPATLSHAMQQVRGIQAGLAFGWPGLAADAISPTGRISVAMTSLPVAEQAYSTSQNDWVNQRDVEPVTLLGVEGRLVAVTTSSRNAVSAFQLASWLTTGDVATGLSSRSEGTLWYRKSQVSQAAKWAGDHGRDETDGTASATEALQTETPWIVPRIPAIDDYLEILAAAVSSTTSREADAQAALETVAAKWQEVTEHHGRDPQARAYRRHLGIEPLNDDPAR